MTGKSIDKFRAEHPDKPSRGTVYNWINKGYLDYYRLPNGRIRIIGEKNGRNI